MIVTYVKYSRPENLKKSISENGKKIACNKILPFHEFIKTFLTMEGSAYFTYLGLLLLFFVKADPFDKS